MSVTEIFTYKQEVETTYSLHPAITKCHGTENIVYVIESAAHGVLFTSCLCQKPERARYERVRAFDTNNE